MDTSSWTPLCTNISSIIQSYSRLRASIYNGGSNVGIEPGLPGMNFSLEERRLRYYRSITAVLTNRRYLPVVPVPYRILGKKKIMIVSFIFDAVPMYSLKMHAGSKCAGGL
eukprot:SAG11_NODE_1129_length_5761_cov_296.866302_5_plen_111_part_00